MSEIEAKVKKIIEEKLSVNADQITNEARFAEDLKAEAKKVTTLETIFTARPITEAMADFNARVRGIGTRLRISDEDADIVDTQARAAVRDVLGGGKEAPP